MILFLGEWGKLGAVIMREKSFANRLSVFD